MGHTGFGAKPYCAHDTNTDKGGHMPPKDQTSDGSIPQEVQQLCQLVGHSHIFGKTIDGSSYPSQILPPDGPIVLMLE
jgi:hypothetical protein